MCYVIGGKLRFDCIAFSPPENFVMSVRLNEFSDDGVQFYLWDKTVRITVLLLKDADSPEEELINYANENQLYALSGFINVKRGNGKAVGQYFGDHQNSATVYRELHGFRRNDFFENQVSLTIEVLGRRRTAVNGVYDALNIPQLKAFLDSVEYLG